MGQYAYGPSGCAWFASARQWQITGNKSTIWSGQSWWNNGNGRMGYQTGQQLRAPAIACWANHIAIIEAVNGNTVIRSEGGSSSYPNNDYCSIRTFNTSNANYSTYWNDAQGKYVQDTFLGYVYLTPQPKINVTWDISASNITPYDAKLSAVANLDATKTISTACFSVYNPDGTVVGKVEIPCGVNGTRVGYQATIRQNSEGLPNMYSQLTPNTTYTYAAYIYIDGTKYTSPVGTFTTASNHTHSYGSWITTKEATCTASGTQERCCSSCSVTETRTVSALGHSYINGVCSNCSDKLTSKFTDVAAGAYYFDSIKWAVDKGITTGYNDATFRPNAACTRAQVVTVLWRAAGCPETKGSIDCFKDAAFIATPYRTAVAWAVEQGITTGFNDGTFRPGATVTRGQFVTFLYRFAGQPATTGSTAGFKDAQFIAAAYQTAVAWAAEEGITTGYNDGTFRPNADCSRAQVVTFLYRHLA